MKGRFVSFEGVDGAGKTSQAKRLAAWLREKRDIAVLETREPGGAPVGESLRQIILAGAGVDGVTEAMLMFAARREHLRQKILPALETGEWVVCDRFADSSIAYQGGGRGVDRSFLAALAQGAQEGVSPDLTFYLRLPPARPARPADDVFEREDDSFYRRVHDSYEAIAAAEQDRIVIVDAVKDGHRIGEETIASVIRQNINKRFFNRRNRRNRSPQGKNE